MNNKHIGIILISLGVLIFIGLQSYWDFEIWQVIDWLLIITLITLGIILIRKNSN